MTKPASSLYTIHHTDLKRPIVQSIDRGCALSQVRPMVFFRADDIGIPSKSFEQLICCFQKHNLPLGLAAVPSWLTEGRLPALRRLTGADNGQWYWHQHGRRHHNNEKTGKKQEFGPSRAKADIYTDLAKGRRRLEQLLEKEFQPVFTPPWNRCSADTLEALVDLDFAAVSRSTGARPEAPVNLPDYQVNVDLHTRKEKDPRLGLANLLQEIEQAISSGLCGIMIHHQRMNRAAVELLDILLESIKNNGRLLPVHFGDLLKAG